MLLQFLLGFLMLVAASYLGTTLALRGFFGREYHERPSGGDDAPNSTDDVPRAGDVTTGNDGNEGE